MDRDGAKGGGVETKKVKKVHLQLEEMAATAAEVDIGKVEQAVVLGVVEEAFMEVEVGVLVVVVVAETVKRGGSGGGFGRGSSRPVYIDKEGEPGEGGHFAGDGLKSGYSGRGAGLGGAIFVGDTATCIIKDHVSISGNSVPGGRGGAGTINSGQGYTPDIFLFREAKVGFDNQQPLAAPYSIMADQMAPPGHLDKGIVKQGPGKLTLSSPDNNYRGGTSIEEGTLAYDNPKALDSSTITLQGGALEPTSSGTLPNPIDLQGGAISGNTLTKTGPGKLTPTNTANNYTGGATIQEGTLSITDPKVLGSSDGNITLDRGTLQPTKTITLANPIIADSGGTIDTPKGTTLITTGSVTGTGPLNSIRKSFSLYLTTIYQRIKNNSQTISFVPTSPSKTIV